MAINCGSYYTKLDQNMFILYSGPGVARYLGCSKLPWVALCFSTKSQMASSSCVSDLLRVAEACKTDADSYVRV